MNFWTACRQNYNNNTKVNYLRALLDLVYLVVIVFNKLIDWILSRCDRQLEKCTSVSWELGVPDWLVPVEPSIPSTDTRALFSSSRGKSEGCGCTMSGQETTNSGCPYIAACIRI